MYKINYNIALIGFGGVNRALVNIISINPEKFYREMGFNIRIVAVSDIFLGSMILPTFALMPCPLAVINVAA